MAAMESEVDMSAANARILMVDDDPGIRDVVSDFLGKHGYEVETAADGREMDEALERGPVDLIVLDVMLPGEDGLAICRRLAVGEGPPVIMLSAMGEDTDRIVGLELGADDYLAKPCNPRELLARVRAVLRRAEHRTSTGAPLRATVCAPRSASISPNLTRSAARSSRGGRRRSSASTRASSSPSPNGLAR